MELSLYRRCRDVVGLFSYVVEMTLAFLPAPTTSICRSGEGGEVYFRRSR